MFAAITTTLTKTTVSRDVALHATHPQHKATKLMNHRCVFVRPGLFGRTNVGWQRTRGNALPTFLVPCLCHIINSLCNARRGRTSHRPDVRHARIPCSPTTSSHTHVSNVLTPDPTLQIFNHRRPKKRNPSDKNRTPAEYAELPPPPPEFKVVSSK
jgi:hypothetical protein